MEALSCMVSNTEYLNFTGNNAQSGGGIFAKLSTPTLGQKINSTHNYFAHNSGENGGAIYFESMGMGM